MKQLILPSGRTIEVRASIYDKENDQYWVVYPDYMDLPAEWVDASRIKDSHDD